MAGDATPLPELPPGLLEEYLENARPLVRQAARRAARNGSTARERRATAARGLSAAPPGAETPDTGSAAVGVPTPRGAAGANCLSPVAPETGGAPPERTGGARGRSARRRPSAGGDLRRGRRGARRAARIRVARARVSLFGVS